MRKRAKVDGNHGTIVAAARSIGASVQSLAAIGNGCPDLLVAYRGRVLLIEVKDPAKPPSKRRLTRDQWKWVKAWRGGPVWIIETEQELLRLLTAGFGRRAEADPQYGAIQGFKELG